MKRKIAFIGVLWLSALQLMSQSSPTTLLVKVKCCMSLESTKPKEKTHLQIESICNQFSGSISTLSQLPGGFLGKLKFPEGTDLAAVKLALETVNEIIYVEQDGSGSGSGVLGTAPNDPNFSKQWGLENTGVSPIQNVSAKADMDIDMTDAWAIEKGDSNIVVAVIDAGGKLDHPEFAGRIWKNKKEIPNNFIDDDNNGHVDDVNGWDFVNNDNNPTDDHGHGTNVAGIIGANGNNGIGYAGVDWNCKLMILKGLDKDNNGYFSDWADAVYYAVNNGARVINMSLGGSGTSQTLQDAVKYAISKNVVVVACMMNFNNETAYIPAAYPGVIAVGSLDPDGKRSNPFFWSNTSGSCYGSHISVIAPGNYTYGLAYNSNTDYTTYWGGTSQAAPLVAGLSSLLLAQNGSRTPADIKKIIENTAEDQVGPSTEDTKGWDKYFGFGKINAFKALNSGVVTGLDDASASKDVKIYPNPSKENFIIDSFEPTDVSVLDMKGTVLGEFKNVTRLETGSQLPKGMYFAKIGTEVYKIIKE